MQVSGGPPIIQGPVAQLKRAPVFETGGRRFESCLARQSFRERTCGRSSTSESVGLPTLRCRCNSGRPFQFDEVFAEICGRVAQPGQSVCLTSRGAKVQILSRPLNFFDVGGHEKSAPSRVHPQANQRENLTSGRKAGRGNQSELKVRFVFRGVEPTSILGCSLILVKRTVVTRVHVSSSLTAPAKFCCGVAQWPRASVL